MYKRQLLLRPYTQNSCFCPDYVRGEKENLIARIRGQMNDKRRYATHRLVEEMCREEAFGVDKLGDVAHVETITPQSLWAVSYTHLWYNRYRRSGNPCIFRGSRLFC